MNYWRIRKEWNDGKWDKTQKGAFTSFESAMNNYKNEYKNENYKIFSPNGEILYPHHEITQKMLSDNIIIDSTYWNDVFNNNKQINCEMIADIIYKYSQKIKEMKKSMNVEIINWNKSCDIYKIPVNKFKIKIVDERKTDIKYVSYFNAGYFAKYKEVSSNSVIDFTLPVANLVADYSFDDLPEVSHKYWKERMHNDTKMYFNSNDNTEQFKDKKVSTLLIYEDNTVDIKVVNDINSFNIKYAVSGYPIILNNEFISCDVAINEGWDLSVTRNTLHPFIGIKEDNYLYVFFFNTTQTGKFMNEEVFNTIKDFNFKSLIKLDGGGSSVFKYNNEYKYNTAENRRINSICIID